MKISVNVVKINVNVARDGDNMKPRNPLVVRARSRHAGPIKSKKNKKKEKEMQKEIDYIKSTNAIPVEDFDFWEEWDL